MPSVGILLGFALVALIIALTPGPNVIYILSRSISQGRNAGLISLGGVTLGLSFYLLCTVSGITALMLAFPYAYDALRVGGTVYLLYLAWQMLKPGCSFLSQVRSMQKDSPGKLLVMGFVTSLLNPSVAILYLSLLPQFIDRSKGSVFAQSIVLGMIHIGACLIVNASLAVASEAVRVFFARRPAWQLLQQWVIGSMFLGLVVRMVMGTHK